MSRPPRSRARAVSWVAVVAGALLAVPGVVLAARAPAAPEGLVFLSPEQYSQLTGAAWLAGVGRALLAGGALLAAVSAPWLLGGQRRARAAAGAVLGAAVGLAVLGAVLVWSGRSAGSAVQAGAGGAVLGALAGPVQWAGLAAVLVGGALLGAGVREVSRERPAH